MSPQKMAETRKALFLLGLACCQFSDSVELVEGRQPRGLPHNWLSTYSAENNYFWPHPYKYIALRAIQNSKFKIHSLAMT